MTLDEAARQLAGAGLESPRAEARLLLADTLGVPRDKTLSGAPALSPEQEESFGARVARRAAREPLAYITGKREFWSLNFQVGPGVLIPRPDSETLIEAARDAMPDRMAPLVIADLGTGSGALLIAGLREFPNATGVGFESSPDAFAWACRNLVLNGLSDRAEMRLVDWSAASTNAFDLIFCNPPYIPTREIESLEPEVRLHEPRAALDGGLDGLDAYRALAGLLPRLLKPGGRAVLELGAGQAAPVELVFEGLKMERIAPDLAGIPRALVLGSRDNRTK